jgi:hypothetical protein
MIKVVHTTLDALIIRTCPGWGGSGWGPDGVRMGSGWGPDGVRIGGPDGVKVGVRMGSKLGSGWGQLWGSGWGPDGVKVGVRMGWVRGGSGVPRMGSKLGSGDPPNRGPDPPGRGGSRVPLLMYTVETGKLTFPDQPFCTRAIVISLDFFRGPNGQKMG